MRTIRSTIRGSSGRTVDDRRAAPDHAQRVVRSCRAAFRVAPIFLFRSALPVYSGRRPRPEPRRRHQRHPAEGVCRRRVRQLRPHAATSQGHRRLQDGQLRPRLAQSQMNLRVSKSFHARRARARRGDRRGLQPVQRHQPERHPRDQSPGDHADDRRRRPDAAPADTVLGRLPAPEQRVGQLGFRFSF